MNWVLPTVIVVGSAAAWIGMGVLVVKALQRSYSHDTHPDAWARRVSVSIFCIGMAIGAVWILAIGKGIWTLVHH